MDRTVLLSCSLGLLTTALVSFSPDVVAKFDSVRAAYGPALNQDVHANDLRLAVRWHLMDFGGRSNGGWTSQLMLEAVYTHWNSTISDSASKSPEGADTIHGFFITPVWRLQDNNSGMVHPYIELGLGVGRISDDQFRRKNRAEPLRKSSNFQYEVKAGGGFQFGANRQYEIGVQWVHYSNGNTSMPNYSFDAVQAEAAYRF